MNSGEPDDKPHDVIETEQRLVEYDTTTPVFRRVACSCGWEATYGSGKTAFGAWHEHLSQHGAA